VEATASRFIPFLPWPRSTGRRRRGRAAGRESSVAFQAATRSSSVLRWRPTFSPSGGLDWLSPGLGLGCEARRGALKLFDRSFLLFSSSSSVVLPLPPHQKSLSCLPPQGKQTRSPSSLSSPLHFASPFAVCLPQCWQNICRMLSGGLQEKRQRLGGNSCREEREGSVQPSASICVKGGEEKEGDLISAQTADWRREGSVRRRMDESLACKWRKVQ